MGARTKPRLAVFLLLAASSIFGQGKDPSGTWAGETIVPNSPDKDVVTMVLKKAGDSYTGTISDSLGMLKSAPLEKAKFENDTITFEFVVTVDSDQIRVSVTLKMSGQTLSGTWESDDGSKGTLEMSRTK